MSERGFSILSWTAAAPGFADPASWLSWAESDAAIDPAAPFTVPKTLPLMTSRRLSPGARAGIECSIAAAGSTVPDFIVTASRDAELPRCEKILTGLADGDPESPTDFTMSVHNAAEGTLLIAKHWKVPGTSVAAGPRTFFAGWTEAAAALASGKKTVLLTFFENARPTEARAAYHDHLLTFPYALSILLASGGPVSLVPVSASDCSEGTLPPALLFLRAYLRKVPAITIAAGRTAIEWRFTA